jgi:hypothetical protein
MMPVREIVDTWASLYSNSAVLRSGVSFAHLGGLVASAGPAIAADRALLRALRRGHDDVITELAGMRTTHVLVVSGLTAVTASGILLMLADLDSYLQSTAFWVKMALIVALTLNGLVLVGADRLVARGSRGVSMLRRASIASIVLWFATTLAGAVLPNAL